MSKIVEVDVLKNWNLSIDHFYSIVKSALGEISSSGKFQIQAAAIPLDVDEENYEWFSRGNINLALDVALEPKPLSDNLSAGLNIGTKLSEEYSSFLETALSLVEEKELPEKTLAKIDRLKVQVENLSEEEGRVQSRLTEKWIAHCDATLTDLGDKVANLHWLQGQAESFDLKSIRTKQKLKIAQKIGLSNQEYENPDHKAIVEAYMKMVSPAATIRYPIVEDTKYGDEAKKFNLQYFAGLPAHDSNLFMNTMMMTPRVSLPTIASSQFGKMKSDITSVSKATESVSTDWGHSGSISYGPIKVKGSATSKTKIEEEFSSVTNMNVSVESLIAIPFNTTWYTPSIYKNSIILENADLFQRWLGKDGTLHIVPTHLVISRGFKVTFKNDQDWQYDYESDFKAGGGGSASFFGINFGSRSSYHKHVERQNVEARGHELVFDDGADNIRILGYHTVTNKLVQDDDYRFDTFKSAQKDAVEFDKKNVI
jgi:hypothetical protein